MIQTRRIRPHFGQIDLLLRDKTDELSFLPSEFVPHTTIVDIKDDYECNIEFEYQIDEDAGAKQSIDMDIELVIGKYTNKVLKIIIDFNSASDLFKKIVVATNYLKNRRNILTKDSHKKNYDLVSSILQRVVKQLSGDNHLRKLLGE